MRNSFYCKDAAQPGQASLQSSTSSFQKRKKQNTGVPGTQETLFCFFVSIYL